VSRNGIPASIRLIPPLRVQLDLHRRVFPEQDVVLEINAGGTQFHMQRGHQFAFDVVGDGAESFILGNGG
jgi:hypothetical protein